eukprot:362254-Chlamydomonas_euryale.AAC.3
MSMLRHEARGVLPSIRPPSLNPATKRAPAPAGHPIAQVWPAWASQDAPLPPVARRRARDCVGVKVTHARGAAGVDCARAEGPAHRGVPAVAPAQPGAPLAVGHLRGASRRQQPQPRPDLPG